MVAALTSTSSEADVWSELLRPDLLVNGATPEQRVVYSDISWRRYLVIDKQRGEDCSVPRFYYLDGELEIMSTSEKHESLKKFFGDLLAIYFEETETEVYPRGHATMWLQLKKAGAEPDESWCVGTKKRFPDFVVEIALSSGGLPKLEVYRRFRIPEVWIWRRGKLEIHVFTAAGEYRHAANSTLLPDLDVALLARCLKMDSWLQARRTFRAALAGKPRTRRQ